jgi:GH3 auxin-responsive promoter
MSLEPFTTVLAARHRRALSNPERAQRSLLRAILTSSRNSPAARALGVHGTESFEEFLDVAPRDYAFYAPLVERTFNGDAFTFGREPIVAFGETSGSLGVPKLIPHTASSLMAIRRFVERVLVFQLIEGKHYFPRFTKWLGVTASTNVRIERGLPIGFISGLIYQIAQKQRSHFMLPTPAVAAIVDWDERLRRTVDEAWTKRVGTILGVPAYLCRFLDAASAHAPGQSPADVWPLLDTVYYSGTSVEPYRKRMECALDRRLVVRGLYAATEGSFGAELDPGSPGEVHLMVDMNVFTFRDIAGSGTRLLSAWEVAQGGTYEVFVTTPAGLVQYQIGDVLEVRNVRPLRVRVVGRVLEEINLATEKMSVKQAQAAIDQVAAHAEIDRERFVVLADPAHAHRHLWIVECSRPMDATTTSTAIDAALSSINPSYAALRRGGAVLAPPRVIVLPSGSFDEYVRAGFARRGQFKFRHIFPDAETLRNTPGLTQLGSHLLEEGVRGDSD